MIIVILLFQIGACSSLLDKLKMNMCSTALKQDKLVEALGSKIDEVGLFWGLFSTDMLVLFFSTFVIYFIAIHGTHFERIPVAMLISMVVYSFFTKFQRIVNLLSRFFSTATIHKIISIVSMIVGALVFILYTLLKIAVIWVFIALIIDQIDDLIEGYLIDRAPIYVTRFLCVVIALLLFYLAYRTYRIFKATYEFGFCAIFASYGSLLMLVTIFKLLGSNAYTNFIYSIANYGLGYTIGWNFVTLVWAAVALGCFIYQTKYINEDYLGDKLKLKDANAEKTAD
ncbi:hypothetical protein ECANGB1_746 [Enterospora canceri]|uniref:YihY/virulence factor BrkB family protein n=1 Tax=Enterospora canceri TaxID=1081671 RepID=A0A1Y1S892_9MICR|nr:hypothetical protein ECANGB1_746 [Enterospora canceri]